MANPTATTDKDARTFAMSIDINATPDDVWRALTDAGELVRWFPLQARVTPGAGGSVFMGWGDKWAGESRIEAWEPGRRLLLIDERQAFDAEGNPLPGKPTRMAIEFTLESHEGKTRLRVVNSGFGQGADWDDELASVSAGWQYELRSLRHYLQRHKGRDRHHALGHVATSLSQHDVWRRLLSPAAFTVTSGSLTEGQTCVIRASTGDQFSGTVQLHKPDWDLAMTVDQLDEGLLRISTWRAGGGTGVQVWLVTYDPALAGRVKEFQGKIETLLSKIAAG